jgi:hypothetical protein
MPYCCSQGTLSEREGSVQLTSSLRLLVFVRKMYLSVLKGADLNYLVKEVNCTDPSRLARTPCFMYQ